MKQQEVADKPTWDYRGHKIAPSVAIKYISKTHELSEDHKACILLWLTHGPANFRKEMKRGLLKPEAREILVWMAQFVLRLKAIRGVVKDESSGHKPSPTAA